MSTQIFNSYEDFLNREYRTINGILNREYRTINGISADFAESDPDYNYEEDNATNVGCWNCSGCRNCWNCSGCRNCHDCGNCRYCRNCGCCFNCRNSRDCEFKKSGNISFLVPAITKIHQKVLEAVSALDALDMRFWHICDTTHCRAGWVVTLAGKTGKALEDETDTPFAAMMIYKASSPIAVLPARLYEKNEDAMKDIIWCAEKEKQSNK